jgi:hypothetical protein
MESSPDRARRHTSHSALQSIDQDTLEHLVDVQARPETARQRLDQLDAEWDLDRTVEAGAAMLGLAGLALGVFVRPAFLVVPAAIGAGVLLFATRGSHPMLPVFRRLGIRSAREIERERYAIKALRGDFGHPDVGLSSDAAAPGWRGTGPLPH